jgi:hypothetical protein
LPIPRIKWLYCPAALSLPPHGGGFALARDLHDPNGPQAVARLQCGMGHGSGHGAAAALTGEHAHHPHVAPLPRRIHADPARPRLPDPLTGPHSSESSTVTGCATSPRDRRPSGRQRLLGCMQGASTDSINPAAAEAGPGHHDRCRHPPLSSSCFFRRRP